MTTGQHTFTGVQLRFETLEDDCLSLFSGVDKAVEALASQDGVEGRGAIFTRAEIVEFILDLAGYVPARPLHQMRILEPSFGGGNFLFPIIDRLLVSWKDSRISGSIVNDLGGAIRAVELHRRTYAATRQAIIKRLQKEGLDAKSVLGLVDCWLRQGDFLLQPVDGDFDFVVGNPPYVRQEQIPAALLAEYRKRYKTIYDRADLYIPFIERSLMMLNKTGLLAFICADRWMKNRYGGPLRKLVAEAYHLKAYVDMTGVPAFSGNVSAYPAIVLIGREGGGFTRVAHKPEMEQRALKLLAGELRTPYLPNSNKLVRELSCVTNGTEPWLFESSDHVNLIRRLEHSHPTIEGAACKIGIGVATGADGVFIGDADKLDVEPDRKLPLVATRDIVSGEVRWRGKCVVNPFDENGCLVNLSCFPRLRDYFEVRQELIKSRHCAQKNPACWYRTIDRILPSLTTTKKLLIPDIKGRANIVFEKGQFYPHHNLYYIVSEEWNLHALQAVLLSKVTMLFMGTYSTKIRGGCLRFQAQYIRRIRIPYWRNVPDNLREELIEAAMCRDIVKCNTASFKLYGLSRVEMKTLENIGD